MSKKVSRTETVDYRSLPGYETKRFPHFLKDVNEDEGIVEHFIAIIGNRDDGGDRITRGAFTKTLAEGGLRVKVLDQHAMDSVTRIVGKPLALREVGHDELTPEVLEYAPDATGGLLATTQYAIDTTRGRDVFNLIKGDFCPESSIGYDAVQVEYINETDEAGGKLNTRLLKEIRLWEYSNVVFGMNRATSVVSAKAHPAEGKPWNVFPVDGEFCVYRVNEEGERTGESLGCHGTEEEARAQVGALYASEESALEGDPEQKGVSGSTTLSIASRELAWDASAAESRVRSWAGAEEEPNAKYRRAFFWYDAENADNFTAYKLPFADVIDGTLTAIPRGIFAVAGVLRGARRGADIPEADQTVIKGRVARYYARMREQFDDETIVVPWEKAGSGSDEDKSVYLDGITGAVRDAFYAQHPGTDRRVEGQPWQYFWVKEVWNDFVIVEEETQDGRFLWKIGYGIEDDTPVFADRSEWIRGVMMFVPLNIVGEDMVVLRNPIAPAAEARAALEDPPDTKAGPAEPPTSERLREEIEAELLDIELMEVEHDLEREAG